MRVSRTVPSSQGGASQPAVCSQGGSSQTAVFVDHAVEAIEPVSWDPKSRPKAAYADVLGILNNCPGHDQSIVFAFLADIQPCPYYGFRVSYDGQDGVKAMYVAALIGSEHKPDTNKVGEGFKVTTTGIKDVAMPNQNSDYTMPAYTTVGFCTLDDLPGFRLDPPRGKKTRYAIALFTKTDNAGLHIHKLECLEPDQTQNAITCMQGLRKLSSSIHPQGKEKLSHSLTLDSCAVAPKDTKKCRTLHSLPTDASLGEK